MCNSHNILLTFLTLFKVEGNAVYNKEISLLKITYGRNSIQIVPENSKEGVSVYSYIRLNNISTKEEI
jgi:hypothetical protein